MPPVQIGSVGVAVQVAMSVAHPVSAGLAVHWAKVRLVPVHAPGLAAQSAAQPVSAGLAEHWAMVTAVPPVQIGSVGLVEQVAMRVEQPASVGVAVHWA